MVLSQTVNTYGPLNLPNTWHNPSGSPLAVQTFDDGVIFGNITGSTQCLEVNSSGVVSGTGSGCGGSVSVYTLEVNGTGLSAGDTVNFNATTPAAPSNGYAISFATSKSGSTDSVSAAIVGDGNSAHCLLGTGVFNSCPSSLPSSPQIGDIPRWNVNGDSAWDAVNAAIKIMGVSIDASNTNDYDSWGTPACGCGNTFSSSSGVAPTATDGWGQTLISGSSASTSTIGAHTGENGDNTTIGILSWYRFSSKFRLGETTNTRAWIGMGVYNSGSGVGVNNLQLDGTTAYAADIPNKTTVGFRYSSTTDTYWQCASIVAGSGSPTSTFTSTLVMPDTNIHLFEMATNATATAVYCYIDHNLVATITTTLPSVPAGGTFPSQNYDLLGAPFFTMDNKNTANAVGGTWYGVNLSLK